MSKSSKRLLDTGALIAIGVLFVGLIMLSNMLLRGVRLDLTENRLYSVSEGTRQIVENIDEPITLYFFFSESASADLPTLRAYANRVRELLEEFALYADGKIRLKIIDPLPFSDEEDQAAQFGLESVQVGGLGSDPLFFGLAGTNAVDSIALIPFFDASKEAFLEYDLAKMVYSLANPDRPVIGLMTGLPVQGGFDQATSQFTQPWVLIEQLEQLFDVRRVEPNVETIDEEIGVLMLLHPKNLGEQTLYAIDQFILRGGNALVFVDPNADADQPAADPSNPYAAQFASRASDLPRLFRAWGVEYAPDQVVLDRRLALSVGSPSGQPVRHYAYLQFDTEGLDREDVVTATLGTVNGATVGHLKSTDDSETVLEPLIVTSEEAMTIPAERIRFSPDPLGLRQGFAPTGERYIVGARIRGKVRTAFPDGPPSSTTEVGEASLLEARHREESADEVNIIVIADTDLLTDRFWVQARNFFGQRLLSAFANNGDLVANSLDNLTGSNDLISIRARPSFSRPFKKVAELERRAEQRFLDTEQQLQEQLDETERKLGELQGSRADDERQILSPEQRAELDRFQQERLRIRKELRQVRRDLDRDIERLGTVLKVINIALVPILIVLLAIAVVLMRARRRQAPQQKPS